MVRQLDGTERMLVLGDIILQGMEQALGMLRSHDDTRLHARLGHTRQHPHEVEDKFRTGMSDDGQIGVDTLGDLFPQFDLHLSVVVRVIFVHMTNRIGMTRVTSHGVKPPLLFSKSNWL